MYALSKLQIQSHAHFTDVCSRCVSHAYTDGMVPPGTAVALYSVNVLWSPTVFTRRRVGVITAMTHVIAYVRLCLGGHGLTVDARLHVCIGRRHHCQAGVRLVYSQNGDKPKRRQSKWRQAKTATAFTNKSISGSGLDVIRRRPQDSPPHL